MSHKVNKYRVRGRLVCNPSLYCMNCGKRNHKYANCMDPLNSYGILCFYRHNPDSIQTTDDQLTSDNQESISITQTSKKMLLWSEMASRKQLVTASTHTSPLHTPSIPTGKHTMPSTTTMNNRSRKFISRKIDSKLLSTSDSMLSNSHTGLKNVLVESSESFIDIDEEPRQLAIRTSKGNDIDLDKYRDLNMYKIMMIRRKHTIPYVEFLRGKYDNNNLEYLCLLFSRMTHYEVKFICDNPSFQSLRKELGLNSKKRKSYRMEYENSNVKFSYIRDTGTLSAVIDIINKIYKTHFLVNLPPGLYPSHTSISDEKFRKIFQELRVQNGPTNTTLYSNPEWGIPKGKRQLQETDLQCAIREFCEETGINSCDLNVFKNCVPLEEIYVGINGDKYRHVYFVGELLRLPENSCIETCKENPEDTEITIPLDAFNKEQVGEISSVKLMGFHKAVALIRRFHSSKKTVVQKAFYNICTYSNFFSVA